MMTKRWNIVLSGYPRAGKTTLAKRLVADRPSFAMIGVDDLRLLLFNEAYPCRDEFLIYSMLAETRDDLLERGYSVVIDSTAPNNATREFLLQTRVKSVNRLLIIFHVRREILIKRNMEKFGNTDAITAWDARWEEPAGNIPIFKFKNNTPEEFNSCYALLNELLESETHPYKLEFYPVTPLRKIRGAFEILMKKKRE